MRSKTIIGHEDLVRVFTHGPYTLKVYFKDEQVEASIHTKEGQDHLVPNLFISNWGEHEGQVEVSTWSQSELTDSDIQTFILNLQLAKEARLYFEQVVLGTKILMNK